MIFDNKRDAIKHLQKILDEDMPIIYYRLKLFLEKNNIEIDTINIVEIRGRSELSLVSIDNFNIDESINITLNSFSLMNYLPLLYHNKDFLKRYLFGIQSSMLDINENIFNIDKVFIPQRTQYIDWLSSWFGIRYSDITDKKAKRKIVSNVVELYKTRGTKGYFIKLIKSLIDIDIKIDDNPYSPNNQSATNPKIRVFSVIIENKLSQDEKEEARLYNIIESIFEKEKPVNSQLNIIYKHKSDIKRDLLDDIIVYERDDYDY